MTQFEYLAIALRLLGGLPSALAPGRRHALHIGACLILLFLVAISFWVFWSLRDVAWTFVGFLIALSIPGTLFYCAAVLIPENPADVESWERYYFEVHRRLFGGLALWALGAATSATVNLGMGLTHPARAVHATALAIGVSGVVSSNPRVHRLLIAFMGVLMAGTLAIQLTPDWLVQP